MRKTIDDIVKAGKTAILSASLLAIIAANSIGCTAGTWNTIGRQWERDTVGRAETVLEDVGAVSYGIGTMIFYNPDNDSLVVGLAKGVGGGAYETVSGPVQLVEGMIKITIDMFKRFEFCYGTGHIEYTEKGPYYFTAHGKYKVETDEVLDEGCKWQNTTAMTRP